MARELKRAAGTTIRGTDDITNHLRFDAINNVLFIFHHARLHLRLPKKCGSNPSTIECLKTGALPRRYVLEVLYSVQKIVFPQWDPDSVALLQSLVLHSSFDPDILDGQDKDFIRDDEEKIQFQYLGPRLVDIYEEIRNPRPRGWLANWLERRSGARYVMFATVLGVLLAVLLGAASLGLSGYQTWITFQAWKNPVGGNGGD